MDFNTKSVFSIEKYSEILVVGYLKIQFIIHCIYFLNFYCYSQKKKVLRCLPQNFSSGSFGPKKRRASVIRFGPKLGPSCGPYLHTSAQEKNLVGNYW